MVMCQLERVDFVICRISSDIEFQRKGVLMKNEYRYALMVEDDIVSDK